MMSDIAALFRELTLGVYVIGVANAGRCDGFTAAWVMQASFEPLLLALSINPGNASYPLLHSGGSFTVNVLQRGQLELARRFGIQSGRDHDKLAGLTWWPGRHGAPILKEALAYFDCELSGSLRAGDHELVLGRAIDGRILAPGVPPLTYAETGDMDGSNVFYREKF
jgi:flavin reductase (DIM6/NTAB) family NADH-FMN oxidoreductase RutF